MLDADVDEGPGTVIETLKPRFALAITFVGLVCLVVAQIWIYAENVGVRNEGTQGLPATLFIVVLVGAFLVIGGLLASLRPQHAVGWLLLAMGTAGVTLSVGSLVNATADSHWLRSFGAWLDAGLWHPSFPAIGLLFLLFPTGNPPTRRWRWLHRALIASWIWLVLSAPFTTPGLMVEFYPDARPVIAGLWSAPLQVPHDAVQIAAFFMILAAATSMVFRFFASRGLERQQLKLFALSVVTIAIIFPVGIATLGDGSLGAPLFVLLPVSCAVAVLRYRLYDLDRLINRTLVYGLLTLGLGALYAGTVIALGEILSSMSGGSDLAIAFTTLLVAALFLPARRAIQAGVDRRFNRRAYDAQRTIDVFSARLRDHIDLDTLRYELLALVDETMEPNRASLWVRGRNR